MADSPTGQPVLSLPPVHPPPAFPPGPSGKGSLGLLCQEGGLTPGSGCEEVPLSLRVHGHSVGQELQAGWLPAGGHQTEEWEALKHPHMGAHTSTHTDTHPGTQIHGPSPIHPQDGVPETCLHVHIHVRVHTQSHRCMSRKPSQGLPSLIVPQALAKGGVCLGVSGQDVVGLGGLLTAAEWP